jgi:hypothetical protein
MDSHRLNKWLSYLSLTLRFWVIDTHSAAFKQIYRLRCSCNRRIRYYTRHKPIKIFDELRTLAAVFIFYPPLFTKWILIIFLMSNMFAVILKQAFHFIVFCLTWDNFIPIFNFSLWYHIKSSCLWSRTRKPWTPYWFVIF